MTLIGSFWKVQGTFFQKGSLAAGGKNETCVFFVIVIKILSLTGKTKEVSWN